MSHEAEVRELVECAKGFAKATRDWNAAVEKIMGRQPQTGIPVDELERAALAVERAMQGEAQAMTKIGDVWYCKVGDADRAALPNGADLPMRKAVEEAFRQLTGDYPRFCFSGWGQTLTEPELAVVEDREPSPPATSQPAPGSAENADRALRRFADSHPGIDWPCPDPDAHGPCDSNDRIARLEADLRAANAARERAEDDAKLAAKLLEAAQAEAAALRAKLKRRDR